MVVPRGQRFIQSGTHLDYLQREELITSAREWERRADACSGQVFMMNLALTRATTAHKYLQYKLKTTLIESSLPEIAELFKKAADCGAFKNDLSCIIFYLTQLIIYYRFIRMGEMVAERGTTQVLWNYLR